MHITLPDPDEGRCKNLRPHFHPADGFFEYLRCTETEGTEHVCRFPKPEHRVLPIADSTSYSTQADRAGPRR